MNIYIPDKKGFKLTLNILLLKKFRVNGHTDDFRRLVTISRGPTVTLHSPKNFDIVECTDYSITVKWNINDPDDCLDYEFHQRVQGSAEWNILTPSNADVSTNEKGYREYKFQNLSPETYYELRMCSCDNYVKSQYTECKTQRTLKTAPKNFDIVECTDYSITVKWNINDPDECLDYEFHQRLQGSGEWNILTPSNADVSINEKGYREYKFQNLSPETYYELRMCSCDNYVKSQYTECKTQRTLETDFLENQNVEWKEEKKWFVQTNAYNFILRNLEKGDSDILEIPGMGKSMLLLQIALFFKCHRRLLQNLLS
ncbi:COL12A [Mytilus coruscus]|uniref:COL12A n=1 Tax=Mytilus coruscus TaxID=42192 RepID=A0A6J8F0C4_MYTCO|nr:COL12A [Mytilus coruscus]